MKSARKYLEKAAAIALKGMRKGKGGPFGAVIVKGDKIVGKAANQTYFRCDPTAHAEVMAIRDACKNLGTLELSGCVMYCVGEPCPMCMAAIYWTMMDGVYFSKTKEEAMLTGFDDSKIYKELALPWQGRTLSMVHFPVDQATDAFNKWEKTAAKKNRKQIKTNHVERNR